MDDLHDRLKRARKDLYTAQKIASFSTSDAATRVYEARIDEFIKNLVAIEAEYRNRGIPLPPYTRESE